MSELNQLIKELNQIIADTGTSIEIRAAHIVDDLLVRYADFYENDATFRAIGDMAIKIHTSHSTQSGDGVMWGEVIHLVHKLQD